MVMISKIPKASRRQIVGGNEHLQPFLRSSPENTTPRDLQFLTLTLSYDVIKSDFMYFFSEIRAN